MTPEQIIFILTAALIVGTAFLVVTTRNLVHAALWLVATLFGVAILYGLSGAGFLALVQIVIYIGAIAILFIFAVMLTRKEMRDKGAQVNRNWPISAFLALLVFGGLAFILSGWDGFSATASSVPVSGDTLTALGKALVSPDAFVLPFEVASILLLAALVGAVYLAASNKE
ncbi:MAG TPA: NADH-quinone oxidoreductase subunit J [Anaerolineales bacterium]|nr:NADH-quinone oxidoreductase subunit J [Anaerolineales bacterium]